MRVSTTDPITLCDIPDPEGHPFVIEGEGDTAIKIYFESDPCRMYTPRDRGCHRGSGM